MLIDRAEFAALIPHAGAMCLLDSVSHWDAERITCYSTSHRSLSNPLRRNDRLYAVHACEYGAQAMAVHGALLARERGVRLAPGFLAALRDVRLLIDKLDAVETPLQIKAERLYVAGDNLIYDFRVSTDNQLLVAGRATVMTPGGQA